MGLKAFESKLERYSKNSNPNSNHLKGIQRIRIQIRTIRKGVEALESKFDPFERDSKHSNPNSDNSKWIRKIRIQIEKFEPFERD